MASYLSGLSTALRRSLFFRLMIPPYYGLTQNWTTLYGYRDMRRLLSLVGFGRVGAFELSVTAGASVLQRLAVPCLNVCFGRFVAEKSAQRYCTGILSYYYLGGGEVEGGLLPLRPEYCSTAQSVFQSG